MSLTAALDSARSSLMATGIQSSIISRNIAGAKPPAIRARCAVLDPPRNRRLRGGIQRAAQLGSLQQRPDRGLASAKQTRSWTVSRRSRLRPWTIRNLTSRRPLSSPAEAGAAAICHRAGQHHAGAGGGPPPRTWRRAQPGDPNGAVGPRGRRCRHGDVGREYQRLLSQFEPSTPRS